MGFQEYSIETPDTSTIDDVPSVPGRHQLAISKSPASWYGNASLTTGVDHGEGIIDILCQPLSTSHILQSAAMTDSFSALDAYMDDSHGDLITLHDTEANSENRQGFQYHQQSPAPTNESQAVCLPR